MHNVHVLTYSISLRGPPNIGVKPGVWGRDPLIYWSSTFQLCDLDNTEAAYNSFVNHIKSAYNIAFPLLPPRPKHKRLSYKHPWMTQGLLKSCKIKSKLYLKFLK